MHFKYIFILIISMLPSCRKDEHVETEDFSFVNIQIDEMQGGFSFSQVDLKPSIQLQFSAGIDTSVAKEYIKLYGNAGYQSLTFSFEEQNRLVHIETENALDHISKYELSISEDLSSYQKLPLDTKYTFTLHTKLDSSNKFPILSRDELLTKIQEQTFRYFWDFGHPESGLARERDSSGETVTSGGSGFGLMAILVGIERGFISREEGLNRFTQIINFLDTKAERFHGVWSHWLNGTSGEAIAFSPKDNGGDLVETSFLAMGLLTVKEYLDPDVTIENSLIQKIDILWESIEWDWHTQGGQEALYWHWSPDFGWEMNMQIQGYNEALISYVLAASSPTHPIDAAVYHKGWAKNGSIRNGSDFYGIKLPLGYEYGGPLFFSHYSFMGINPTGLSDDYASYWEQNRNHTLINRSYCINNPKSYLGYSSYCWGLTASDGNKGYSAHSPTNDRGVITPTAAISSIPYTPEESIEAIKHFYYVLGDKLWGKYGFYDAFNLEEGWTANSYLAIDQGPIIVMIENYRSGLCWDLFMQNKDVQNGLNKLGFTQK